MEHNDGLAVKMDTVPTEEAINETGGNAGNRAAEIPAAGDGRYKYDPIARYYYPPPYPREQGHGSGA